MRDVLIEPFRIPINLQYQIILCALLCVVFVVVVFLMLYTFVPAMKRTAHELYPENFFLKAIEIYDDNDDMRDFIDGLQISFMCCGMSMRLNGFADWNSSSIYGCNSDDNNPLKCSVPASCCQGEFNENGDVSSLSLSKQSFGK